jgi:hypothetical protein
LSAAEVKLARTVEAAANLTEAKAAAARVLERYRAHRDRLGAKAGTVAPASPADEPRAAKVSRIRGAVFARAAGVCEFCRARREAHPGYRVDRPVEWHHIIGGGLRQVLESVETTAAICIGCHKGWGKSDLDVLAAAKAWALRLGFPVALAAIEKRIAKVEEARRG